MLFTRFIDNSKYIPETKNKYRYDKSNKCEAVASTVLQINLNQVESIMNIDNPNTKKNNRIGRYIRREILYLKRTKNYRSKRNAYLISDSKSK